MKLNRTSIEIVVVITLIISVYCGFLIKADANTSSYTDDVLNTYENDENNNAYNNDVAICICDAEVESTDESGKTTLLVMLPSGDVEVYSVYDAPEDGVNEVALAMVDENDVTTWEVVGLR